MNLEFGGDIINVIVEMCSKIFIKMYILQNIFLDEMKTAIFKTTLNINI